MPHPIPFPLLLATHPRRTLLTTASTPMPAVHRDPLLRCRHRLQASRSRSSRSRRRLLRRRTRGRDKSQVTLLPPPMARELNPLSRHLPWWPNKSLSLLRTKRKPSNPRACTAKVNRMHAQLRLRSRSTALVSREAAVAATAVAPKP